MNDKKMAEDLVKARAFIEPYILKAGFQLDEEHPNTVSWSTRQHGDVGEERAGDEDIKLAKDLQQLFRTQKYPSVTLDMEVADEWVHLQMTWHTLEARLKVLEYQRLRASWSATTPEKKAELASRYEELVNGTRAHYSR